MSGSRKIADWKTKAEIDYFPLFMALWLSFEIWLSDNFEASNQRQQIEDLKSNTLSAKPYKKLREFLIDTENSNPTSMQFKSNLRSLEAALVRAEIKYSESEQDGKVQHVISFNDALIDRKKKAYEDLVMNEKLLDRKENHHVEIEDYEGQYENYYDEDFEDGSEDQNEEPIRISESFVLVNDIDKIYVAYIEIAYQFRCKLFHGQLEPSNDAHGSVTKFLYLTLSDLMEDI